MEHAAEGISREDLLAYARSRGVTVSSAQLDRWRKEGLLPSPVRRSRGRPLGTEAIYPPDTGPQLIAVARQIRRRRSVAEAFWQLWWDGQPVSITHLRRRLDKLLNHLERLRKHAESRPADIQRVIQEWAALRPSDERERLLRRGFKRSGVEALSALAIDLRLGIDQRAVDGGLEASLIQESIDANVDTTPAFERGAGGVIANPEQFLATVSRVLDPDRLRRAFALASNSDIEDARREMHKLEAAVGVLPEWLQMIGFTVNRSLLDLDAVRTDDKYSLLLVWLSLRQVESVRQVYDGMMVLSDALQAGQMVQVVGESIEVHDA